MRQAATVEPAMTPFDRAWGKITKQLKSDNPRVEELELAHLRVSHGPPGEDAGETGNETGAPALRARAPLSISRRSVRVPARRAAVHSGPACRLVIPCSVHGIHDRPRDRGAKMCLLVKVADVRRER